MTQAIVCGHPKRGYKAHRSAIMAVNTEWLESPRGGGHVTMGNISEDEVPFFERLSQRIISGLFAISQVPSANFAVSTPTQDPRSCQKSTIIRVIHPYPMFQSKERIFAESSQRTRSRCHSCPNAPRQGQLKLPTETSSITIHHWVRCSSHHHQHHRSCCPSRPPRRRQHHHRQGC